MNDKKQVNKALDQEEITILSDIATLIDQLKNMNTERDPGMEPGMEGEEMASQGAQTQDPTGLVDDPKKITVAVSKEADTNTPSDAATASDPAKDRIEDAVPEESQDNAEEVSKALLAALKSVMSKKAEKAQPNPIVSALQGLTQVVKNLQENQDGLSTAFTNVLDGIGVTEQIKAVEKALPEVKGGNPIASADTTETANHIQWIMKQLGGAQETKKAAEEKKNYYTSPNDGIQKNLQNYNVLKALALGVNNGR